MIVSEVARAAGVTPHAVRYYSRIGLLNPLKQFENQYRQFGRDDVRRLAFIKKAQRLGFTLHEIRQLLDACDRRLPTCPMVRLIVSERIEATGAEIDELMSLRSRMRKALATWQHLPDGEPDGETVCRLIESFSED